MASELIPERLGYLNLSLSKKKWNDVRSFLGFRQSLRAVIKKISGVSAPLKNLTEKDQGIHKFDSSFEDACECFYDSIITDANLIPGLVETFFSPFR